MFHNIWIQSSHLCIAQSNNKGDTNNNAIFIKRHRSVKLHMLKYPCRWVMDLKTQAHRLDRLSDIHKRLQNVYWDSITGKSNVHRWMKKLKERETRTEDKPLSESSSTENLNYLKEDSTRVWFNNGSNTLLLMKIM